MPAVTPYHSSSIPASTPQEPLQNTSLSAETAISPATDSNTGISFSKKIENPVFDVLTPAENQASAQKGRQWNISANKREVKRSAPPKSDGIIRLKSRGHWRRPDGKFAPIIQVPESKNPPKPKRIGGIIVMG
jgi:hypothetical protein